MSLDIMLRDHLQEAGDLIALREPDLEGVTKRGRRRRTVRYAVTGILAGTLFVAAALLLPPTPSEQPVLTVPLPTTTLDTPTSTVPQQSAGSFETSLGIIDWRHVTGDSDALPFPTLGLVQTSLGFAAISYQGGPGGDPEGVRYWRSSDGYEWSASALPVPVEPVSARIQGAGEVIWLITFGPDTLWRSADGESWTEVGLPDGAGTWGSTDDLHIYDVDGATWLISGAPPAVFILDGSTWIEIDAGAMVPPDITGGRWRLWWPATPVAISGTTVIPWDLAFDVDWVSILGVDPSPYPYSVWNEEAQAIEVWGSYGDGPMATLDVVVSGRQIVFIDSDSGQQVHEIVVNDPRIEPATLLESHLRVGEYQLAVVDEQGSVVQSRVPWGELSPDWGEPGAAKTTTLFLPDQLVGVVSDRGQGDGAGAETWTSPDGVNWTGPSQPEFIDDEAAPGDVYFHVEKGTVLADVWGAFGNEVWVTTDGLTWTFTGLGGGNATWSLARIGSGGLYYRDFDVSSGGMAVSADFRQWELVDPGLEPQFGEEAGSVGGFSAGDTFFYAEATDSGSRQMYVLKLQG